MIELNTYWGVLLQEKVKLSHYCHGGNNSFLTLALDMGEWSASCRGHTLPLGKDPRYPLDRRLGGPHSWPGHRGWRKKSFDSARNRTLVVHFK